MRIDVFYRWFTIVVLTHVGVFVDIVLKREGCWLYLYRFVWFSWCLVVMLRYFAILFSSVFIMLFDYLSTILIVGLRSFVLCLRVVGLVYDRCFDRRFMFDGCWFWFISVCLVYDGDWYFVTIICDLV